MLLQDDNMPEPVCPTNDWSPGPIFANWGATILLGSVELGPLFEGKPLFEARRSAYGAKAVVPGYGSEPSFLAEAVEQLRALPDWSESLEFDSSVGL